MNRKPRKSWSWGPPKPKAADLAARLEHAVALAMTVPIPAVWDGKGIRR